MKIRLAYPVAEMSGKVGGDFGIVMFQHRGLQVARTLVTPNNPSTTPQDTIRGYLASAATAFQSVTASEKTAWETFAELVKSRIMGQEVVRPAIAEYCKINCLRQIAGQSITDTAPTTKPDFAVTAISAFEYDSVNEEMNVVFTHNAPATANRFVLVRWTAALASGVVVPKRSDYRLAETVAGSASIVALDSSPQTIAFDEPWTTVAVDSYAGVSITPLNVDYVPGVEFSDVIQVTAE
jgi:hypothetical protein